MENNEVTMGENKQANIHENKDKYIYVKIKELQYGSNNDLMEHFEDLQQTLQWNLGWMISAVN